MKGIELTTAEIAESAERTLDSPETELAQSSGGAHGDAVLLGFSVAWGGGGAGGGVVHRKAMLWNPSSGYFAMTSEAQSRGNDE